MIENKYLETAIAIAAMDRCSDHADENMRLACRKKLCRYLSPITHGGGFKASGRDLGTIIGHWCEDGSDYEIAVPYQLRDRFIALLNFAEAFDEVVRQEDVITD